MLNQFHIDFADSQRTALKQYCKMEHVLPEALVFDRKAKKSMKLHLETTAFHLLQRIDRRLDAMIGRLMADMEQSGRIQRPVS